MSNTKYKVGDKVRIVEKWNEYTCQSCFGRMDKWLGKVMTIRKVIPGFTSFGVYQMEEDKHEHIGEGWLWNDACIEGLATEDTSKIVITTDGTETIARLYDGKKVIKSATAKCSPYDKFDFNTGVKIAVDRLLGVDKSKTAEKPYRKSKFEVGKYYKADGLFNGIIKITKIAEKGDEQLGIIVDRMYYEVVEGMKGDNGDKSFIDGSVFEMCLTPIDYTKKPELYNGKVVCTKSNLPFWTVGKVYEIKDGIITDDDGDIRGKNPFKSFEDFKKRFVDDFPTRGILDFIHLVD